MTKLLQLIFAFLLFQISFAEAQPQVPQWAVNLYMTDSTKLAPTESMPNIFAPKDVQIVFFSQINDTASYCIYKADNGVCVLYYLATQKYRKPFASMQIGDKCSSDNSSISFTSTSFRLDSLSNIIISTQETETASEQFVTNDGQFRRFKPGFNRTNAIMAKEEIIRQIKITDAGSIEQNRIR